MGITRSIVDELKEIANPDLEKTRKNSFYDEISKSPDMGPLFLDSFRVVL